MKETGREKSLHDSEECIANDNADNEAKERPTLVNSMGENPDLTGNQDEDGWMDILGTGNIKKKILKSSAYGVKPERTDICTISYDGFVNDNLVESVKDMKIHLGDLEVVHGIDLALALMEVGEEAELIVGPRFAYGSQGFKPSIPPNAILKYTISLTEVKHEESISELTIDDRRKYGNKKKERGNWWYSREEYAFAIQCYRRALEYFDDTEGPQTNNDTNLSELIENKLKTYNNLAAAQIKVSAFDGALMSLGHVLALQPCNVKALFRKSKILKEQGAIEESISIIRKALILEPESQSLNQELSSLLAILRENNAREVNLFKKMLGNDTNSAEKNSSESNNSSSSSSSPSWRWLAFVSFAAAVIGAFAVKYKY